MRDEEKKRKLKRLFVLFGLIVIAVLLAFACFYTFTQSKLTNYLVKAENLTCTDKDQISKFLKDLKLNYFAFNKLDLENKLKQKFFCIGRIDATVSFPEKLETEVFGRKAEFAALQILVNRETNPPVDLPKDYQVATQSSLAAEPVKIIDEILKDTNEASGSAYYLIDSEGVVFDESYGSVSFPVLKILGEELKVGGRVRGDLIEKVKEVVLSLSSFEAPTDNIIIFGDKLIIDTKPRLIFSLTKRIDYQTTSLQLILAQAKMNSDPSLPGSNSIESIDLRFNKPVVVYTSKKK